MDVIKLGDGKQEKSYSGTENVYVRGQKGADEITGGDGNDVIEGNQGKDILNGGKGDDILFGGVGNDTLTGGDGEDTFAMRITHGGVNTITDFEVGTDSLQFLVDRKHFVLAQDLAKNEGRVDGNLNGKIANKLNDRFFNGDLELKAPDSGAGVANATAFVDKAMSEQVSIKVDGDTLVVTFFEGKKGTTINLEGLGNNALINSIMGDKAVLDPTVKADALMIDNILGVLTGDIPVFEGSAADYSFQTYGYIRVVDSIDGRDGESKVYIENGQKIQFGDDIYTWQRGHNAGDNMTAISNDGTLMVGMHGVDKLIGGDGADVLIGDNGTHFHYKGSGDELSGGEGNDILIGGAGNDMLDGGLGEDTAVFGGSILDYNIQSYSGVRFTDTVSNRDGVDMLNNVEFVTFEEGTFALKTGHNAGDNMVAEDGVDTLLVGYHGPDTLTGGSGNDVLMGDNGASFTYQGGDDILDGGAGDDILIGGSGNDVLEGGAGKDDILAGAGDDSIISTEYRPAHLATVMEDNTIDGGEGIDSLTYNDTYSNVDSLKVTVTDSDTFIVVGMKDGNVMATDTVKNVEVLTGTRGDDILDFSGLGHGITYNDKSTGAGEDEVTGTDHDDVIEVMHGDDTIVMSGGQDYVDGGSGTDTLIITTDTKIIVEQNGPDYKQEFKVYEEGSSDFTIVTNVELINFNGEDLNLDVGVYTH